MMNFSDETVSKVGVAVVEKLALISRNVPLEDLCDPLAQAALASLTIADLMQVEEVQKAMAESFKNGIDSVNAQKPLTEPKQ